MKYVFKSAALLEVALTHTSHAYENGGQHNERLEFLGPDEEVQRHGLGLTWHEVGVLDQEGPMPTIKGLLKHAMAPRTGWNGRCDEVAIRDPKPPHGPLEAVSYTHLTLPTNSLV